MASVAQWIEGARPRTLPNAVAPVITGTGAAASLGEAVWWKALLALVVSLALNVGVNYANDYSDGVRGTDDVRVGPLRLVGSKVAAATAVRTAAFIAFGVAAVVGLVLALTTAWWLILLGLASILGAWYYTGGRKPYGYQGFGEIAVFVFFGLVAVLGTEYVQAEEIDWAGFLCAVAVGCLSCSMLVANNLRDIPTDTAAGKITLAVRLGDAHTRSLQLALLVAPFVVTVFLAIRTPWALAALAAAPLAARANAPVRSGGQGRALIPALRDTGFAMLAWSIITALAMGLS
jgi:1,4-dihydroxy-2-naphthoate octaprenyltransferase